MDFLQEHWKRFRLRAAWVVFHCWFWFVYFDSALAATVGFVWLVLMVTRWIQDADARETSRLPPSHP
jgi:hypothetical protein